MNNEEILRKLQLTELEILKEVVRICELHQIKYWLAHGTMLGAVRHQGFIPWDDDVDIYMRYEDINKFAEACKSEMGSEYFLETFRTEPMFQHIYHKVRKNGTLMLQADQTEKDGLHHGIFIDIFPVFPLAASEKAARKQIRIFRELQKIRGLHTSTRGNVSHRFMKHIYEKCLSTYEGLLWKRAYHLAGKNYSKCIVMENEFYSWHPTDYEFLSRWIFDKKAFEENGEYLFEDREFSGIKEYNAYLTKLYTKDYMTPVRYNQHTEDFQKVLFER